MLSLVGLGLGADAEKRDDLAMTTAPYRGVFPVAPTIFDAGGELDLHGQRRAIDFMIDAGAEGLCILANFSE
ncbi:hypothetical protein AEGHOMDF_2042 [Methylobacterium soli]|nr:hypothetical protein AEGHOMDF_2042 [Methylobacterium soli]